jgi:hypothetical protein
MYVFNNDEVGTVVEHSIINTAVNVALRYVCRKYIHFANVGEITVAYKLWGNVQQHRITVARKVIMNFFRIREYKMLRHTKNTVYPTG